MGRVKKPWVVWPLVAKMCMFRMWESCSRVTPLGPPVPLMGKILATSLIPSPLNYVSRNRTKTGRGLSLTISPPSSIVMSSSTAIPPSTSNMVLLNYVRILNMFNSSNVLHIFICTPLGTLMSEKVN